ncbi:hypothetical protein B0F90DRAFT_716383 [Multifurca ochricompacta]|uniref:Uncharacterized protein n=1 Tax=Multifurca ochricompacta TaxID=376703 RepID=A0AAD4M1G2_9AGAM|nr:hypothetical protein B0F90DRAFT_716383 [Multifurca ochricompacta]
MRPKSAIAHAPFLLHFDALHRDGEVPAHCCLSLRPCTQLAAQLERSAEVEMSSIVFAKKPRLISIVGFETQPHKGTAVDKQLRCLFFHFVLCPCDLNIGGVNAGANTPLQDETVEFISSRNLFMPVFLKALAALKWRPYQYSSPVPSSVRLNAEGRGLGSA